MAQAVVHASRTAVAPLTWNPTEHLLARASFGATPYTSSYVTKYGPDAWYKQQVAYGKRYAGYAGNAGAAALGPLLSKSPYDVQQWLIDHDRAYGWDAMDQLTMVTLGLQGWSPAQLYEVLVDVFSNHLNVANHNGDVWNTRHVFDRDVIRPHVMGSFTDMLLASAKSPAMLIYLSLADSTKIAVNENYGREVLELHTVGLHYTQSDVTNAAKLLTGRTLDDNQHYVYDDYIHGTGPVQVLGFTHANSSAAGGEKAGDELLRYLAALEYTALNVARKLCVRLVSDSPSAALINDIAHVYLDNNTQILPMVSAILRSTEFWESRGKKVRRPREHVLATRRRLGTVVTDWSGALNTLHWMTSSMGDGPLDWPAPNGYPDVAAAWQSSGTLLALWEMHTGFINGWYDGMRAVDLPGLYASEPATSGDAIRQLSLRLTGMTWSSAHRATLQKFLNEPASTPMSNSVLRWWDDQLATLILDAPHHHLK